MPNTVVKRHIPPQSWNDRAHLGHDEHAAVPGSLSGVLGGHIDDCGGVSRAALWGGHGRIPGGIPALLP